MPKYLKKVQVLLTEKQYKDLEEIASYQKKKLGSLVREAIEEYHLKKKKQQEIAEAADRLLSLPEVPAPENWEEFEKELAKTHGFHEWVSPVISLIQIFFFTLLAEITLWNPPSVKAIHGIRDGHITAVINTEIIQEILYHFQWIKQLPAGIRMARDVVSISSRILPVAETDLSFAIKLLESYPRIQTRDAFHAATMITNGIREIISTDPHFDLIPDIKRIDPLQIR